MRLIFLIRIWIFVASLFSASILALYMTRQVTAAKMKEHINMTFTAKAKNHGFLSGWRCLDVTIVSEPSFSDLV